MRSRTGTIVVNMSELPSVLDVAIFGAGPAGLAAACAAQDAGLTYVVLEKSGLVQSLVDHPQQIRYFSPADEMAIGRIPFFVAGGHKPTREDALAYYRAVASTRNVNVKTWEAVTEVSHSEVSGARFAIRTQLQRAGDGDVRTYLAHYVLVCTGTFPNPKIIGVTGEDGPNVYYRLQDPTPFYGRNIAVIGGGNSAATAAMTLAEAGAQVKVLMRRAPAEFQSQLRPFIVRDLNIMANEKRLELIPNTEVVRISTHAVTAVETEYGQDWRAMGLRPYDIPTDFVFIMAGHGADRGLFEHLGIALGDDGLPIFDKDTAETAIPGMYVAGSLSRANIILESRSRAVEIIKRIAGARDTTGQ